MAVHFSRCCHPLPGDRVVGIVTTGKGVSIHTIDCEQLGNFSEQSERWIDLAWDQESQGFVYVGRISVVISNKAGSLGELATVIAKNEGNIINLKITGRHADFFDITIDIDVRNVKHLVNIIAALRATSSIATVERVRS